MRRNFLYCDSLIELTSVRKSVKTPPKISKGNGRQPKETEQDVPNLATTLLDHFSRPWEQGRVQQPEARGEAANLV